MNRLDFAAPGRTSCTSSHRFHSSPGDDWQPHPEAFFTPQHYESNYCYPLVVWLHGQGNSERQLSAILPGISSRNFVGAGVRGTAPSYASSFAGMSPQTTISGYGWQQSSDQIEAAGQRVAQLVQHARQRFQIDTSRIFIAGQGSGGTMALRLALLRPTEFAGVISIGGCLPAGDNPLRDLDEIRQLPIFLASGAASNRYQSEHVCEDLRLLHAAGISVTLRHYPSGDEVHPQCLHDVNAWMMECLASRCAASIVL